MRFKEFIIESKEPQKAEVNNKFKNSGLGYVVDLIS